MPISIGTGLTTYYALTEAAPPPTGIAFRSAGSSFLTPSSITNWVIDAPDGVLENDVLVCFIEHANVATTVTPPDGSWTDRTATIGLLNSGYVFTKAATASEPSSYTFTLGAGRNGGAVIIAVSGSSTPTSPIDVAAYTTDTASPMTMASVAATTAGLLIGICYIDASRTLTADAAMTERGARTTTPVFSLATEQLSASGATPARAFTSSGALTHNLVTIVIKD